MHPAKLLVDCRQDAAVHEAGPHRLFMTVCPPVQGPNKPPVLPPEDLLSSVASGGPHKGPWSPHLLQPLLTAVARVLRTAPLAAPALLPTAAAIACGAPCHETVRLLLVSSRVQKI